MADGLTGLYPVSGVQHIGGFNPLNGYVKLIFGCFRTILEEGAGQGARPTMDIDMLGKTSNEEADIVAQIRDILTVDVEADGLAFTPDSIRAERITEDADYEGIRIRFQSALGSARLHLQIDIGFGDVVYPEPEESELPTMLNYPVPRLLCQNASAWGLSRFQPFESSRRGRPRRPF